MAGYFVSNWILSNYLSLFLIKNQFDPFFSTKRKFPLIISLFPFTAPWFIILCSNLFYIIVIYFILFAFDLFNCSLLRLAIKCYLLFWCCVFLLSSRNCFSIHFYYLLANNVQFCISSISAFLLIPLFKVFIQSFTLSLLNAFSILMRKNEIVMKSFNRKRHN